ncbi:MAG: DUF362 domain-containing protein [Candidatus Riflebacteria bacterium]|nr:DUF362 domain-containing protein [Candidatus Riflebacteria bacterium]
MKRRTLLRLLALAGLTLSGGKCHRVHAQPTPSPVPPGTIPDVVWVENGEPEQLLAAGLNAMGSMKRFVSSGDVVVVKPNIGWDRAPDLAATTNPDLVAAVVKECLAAGAKKVRVFDRTCNNARRCYVSSGIQEKAEAAGAEVSFVDDGRYKSLAIKNGEELAQWPIYQDYLDATKVINVPVAKHHGLSRVTLGLKNLMGVMGGDRGSLHTPFDKKLIDIAGMILPALTIIDGYRILLRNGPVGGNPRDVKQTRTLVMSPCTVAADHAALPLFGLTSADVGHLQAAVQRGLNKVSIDKMRLQKIRLS